MNHNQIYNPYIEEPSKPSTEDCLFRRAAVIVACLVLAMFVSHFSGCVAEADKEAQDVATAAFPSKPTHEQQVAYREDEREQLLLKTALTSNQ